MVGRRVGARERLKQLFKTPPREWYRLRPTFSRLGEDLALVRLLNPRTGGTYVDVGANDPIATSNTAYFYYMGWRGLTIDPNPAFKAAFRKKRPGDIHLTVGVSEEAATLTYHKFGYDVMNTFSKERADQLTSEGLQSIGTEMVPCSPLHELVKAHLGDRHVDLLSVDCEGFDLAVLRSAKLDSWRPTAIVIEDFETYTNFRDGRSGGAMDEFLRSVNYSPVWQAAWSSIYVANDWRSLPAGAFDPPASETDYMPRPTASSVEQPVL